MNAETARVICSLIDGRIREKRKYLNEMRNTPLQRELGKIVDDLEEAKDEIRALVGKATS